MMPQETAMNPSTLSAIKLQVRSVMKQRLADLPQHYVESQSELSPPPIPRIIYTYMYTISNISNISISI